MSDSLVDKLLNTLMGVLCAMGTLLAIFGTIAATMAIFFAVPQGYYIKASGTGFTSAVYENIKYGEDRLVFHGPSGKAWKIYLTLSKPPVEPESRFKTLELRDTVQL